MPGLLRCHRGSVAFATIVAAIPVIGMVALGGEAASWYVTKQHVQNAADAAAYAGALRVACSIGAQNGVPCGDTQSVTYRGKEFAAQNNYCNAGDTSYPGGRCAATLIAGTTQAVAIDRGTFSAGSWTTSAGGSYVRAQVSQQQPAYIATVLGLTRVNIAAQAIAQVQVLSTPCVLALTGSISFKDSAVDVQAPGCGFASNSPGVGLDFKANPTVSVGSLATMGSCQGSTLCNTAFTYTAPIPNPLASLSTAMTGLTIANKCPPTLTPYTAGNQCVNDKFTANKPADGLISISGVYFFSGAVKLTGTGSITTAAGVSATMILLPGASLSMVGGTSINITAQSSVATSSLPASLQASASLLTGVGIVDLESGTPKTNGGATITANGVIYFPNADLDFQGNPTATVCGELIAASIQFAGSPFFSNSGCPVGTPIPTAQVVALVQ